MTYEQRQPLNYSFGTLSNAAAISDTTLTSTDFSSGLPSGLSTTLYVPVVLQDPSTKVFEVVWVTAHTAAATTATVIRAREGTTARAWGSGTLWTVSPTIRDGILTATAATIPTDLHTGAMVLETDTGIVKRKSPTANTVAGQGMLAALGVCLGAETQKTAANATIPSTATILVRMGNVVGQAPSAGAITITFPVAFPTAYIGAVAGSTDDGNFVGAVTITNGTTTSMKLKPLQFNSTPPAAASLFWIAFGY